EELYINTGRISEDLFPLLAETYLEGREFTAGFIGERIGAPLEVISPSPVYSEEVKGKSSMPEKLIPVEDASIDNTIMMYTRRIIETLGVRCYGRVDWKLNGNGSLFFLEINLTPGLSPYYSSFPRSYENRLGSYSDMVKEILLLADANYELRQARYGKL
ncbi:MAG TPA: D-alanine--D-alanine ligase, partial [Leptospiraceae bacterium]|nr:D-alanine--D-alanine ligase [Leptospiraceae bacterium]